MRLRASRDIGIRLSGSCAPRIPLAADLALALSFAAVFGPGYMAGMIYFTLNGGLSDNTRKRDLVFLRDSPAFHPETGAMVEDGAPIYMKFRTGGGVR